MQVAIWKLSHINDTDVPKPSEENASTKNHNEVLQPLWTTGGLLLTNFTDILEHQHTNETDDDELIPETTIPDGAAINMTKKLTAMYTVMTVR